MSSFINSQSQTEWIDFGNGESGQLPEIDMYTLTDFSIDIYGINRYQKTENDTTYDVMFLPNNFGKTTNIGYPQLPILTFNIEITVDTPSITINSMDTIVLENFHLIPAQESETISVWDPISSFEKNDSVYSSNSFYPSTNIMITLPSKCRGHKIATIIVYPLQFNPVTNEIKVTRNIDFKVHGAGSVEYSGDNAFYDSFLSGNVLNYVKNANQDNVIDLLILTPDEFYDELEPLREWKEKSGIRTTIKTQSDLYPEYPWIVSEEENMYEGIGLYIKNAYDTWGSESPEFVLLIGEPELLPTHYWFTYDDDEGPIATDYYFSTMDIDFSTPSDWIADFPDIHVGRISINDVNELDNIINKIITYEKDPPLSQTEWYNSLSLNSYFEDDGGTENGCTEGKYMTLTTETIRSFISNNYNSNYVYFTGCADYPLYYQTGDPVQLDLHFFTDPELATTNILSDLNSGCIIANHRGHGSSRNGGYSHDGWLYPVLNETHVSSFTNNGMLPVMFSINCQSGWFDGATDFPNLPNGNGIDEDCIGELLLSKQQGGIIGFIGSSRNSGSGYNDEFCKGLYDAIWESFNPFQSEISTPIYKFGAIKNHGLLFMYDQYMLCNTNIDYDYITYPLTDDRKRRSFESYNVLGDPTLEIWTGIPQQLYAYVDFIDNSVTIYNDNEEVIPDCKVVFQQGPEESEEYEVKVTDINGKVYSNLLNYLDVEVSAVKHNYIPWYTTIISDNTIWGDEEVRGNIIVKDNSTLTFNYPVTIPKYSRIVIMEGATLSLKENVNMTFENGHNDILAYGSLSFLQNSSVSMVEGLQDCASINLLNDGIFYSFEDISFSKINLIGSPHTLTLTNTVFSNSSVEITEANINVIDSDFNNSWLTAAKPRNSLSYVHITDNCSFFNTSDAIYIDGYFNYIISGCEIMECQNGIRIFNAGSTTGEKIITLNSVYENSSVGLTIYHSYANVTHNIIYNNGYGIKCLDRSNVQLKGDSHEITQEIRDNTFNEVYASRGSFPPYFHWNLVEDDDNQPGDPMVLYKGTEEGLDVTYNCWGSSFSAETDLEPWANYIWEPEWECLAGSGSGEGSAAESMYLAAQDEVANGNYTAAKSGFQEVVFQYPSSKYAHASLKEMYSLEFNISNDYAELKNYYTTEPSITNNPDLTKLADFLVNFCEIKLENWPTAIAWFEDVIQNPESIEDSIFAIIDLGYTYFLMNNVGLKSSFAGNLIEHIPVSQEQFNQKRDFLLSLLPGDTEMKSSPESLGNLKDGELLQNIPNPFKGTTKIWYKLGYNAKVEIMIYNNSGQRIQSFNIGPQSKGNHFIEFDGSDLPDGVYFYSININCITTDTKKMTILK